MKVIVNEDCIGCGMCEGVCPEVFQLNTGGLSEVVGDPNSYPDATREAAAVCPVNAIEIAD